MGITKFLVERAKQHLISVPAVNRIYFIQRYPDRPKLVYSPVACDPLFCNSLMWLIPGYLHTQWALRKHGVPAGTELVAICAIVSHRYVPTDPLKDRMDKAGSEVFVISVHTKDAIHAYQMFYNLNLMAFDALEKCDLPITGVAKNLFPKDL